jgi:hypothetical protein
MATIYWVGGTGTWATTGTANWANTSGGTGGTGTVPTAADDVIFNAGSGTGTVTLTGALTCRSLVTTGAAAFTFTSTGTLTIAGSLTLVANITWSATGLITFTDTGTITVANTMPCSMTSISAAVTTSLGSNLTLGINNTFTWGQGGNQVLALNNFILSCGIFSSNIIVDRTITFGTGAITVTGSGSSLLLQGAPGLAYTGTPTINISNASATAATMSVTGFTATNAFNFNITVGTYVLAFATNGTVGNLNFTGFTGTWTNNINTITIYGSMTLVAGMTLSQPNAVWTFGATTTGKTITTAGKLLGGVAFNGVGGGWTLGDALNIGASNSLTFTNGTFNTGNFAINTTGQIAYTAGTSCTINLGSSVITSTSSNALPWSFGTPTNLTFNAGTSSIVFSNVAAKTFAGGGLTYASVSMTATTNVTNAFQGANTFTNLTLTPGTSTTTVMIYTFDSNITVTGTLTCNGASITNRAYIQSSVAGTQRTITAAAENLNYVNFQDINAAGAAIPFTGTNLGNYGNNANITFVTTNFFWVLGTGIWDNNSSTNWALSSGGAGSAGIPLPQDNVTFDVNSNSGTSAFTATINNSFATCNNFTVSGLDGVMTLAGLSAISVYGSLSWPATNLTVTHSATFNFLGTATNTISTNNIAWPSQPVFNGTGTWTLGTACTMGNTTFAQGTFNTNNFAWTAVTAKPSGGGTKTINLGASAILITGSSTAWNFAGPIGLTFNAGTSTITVNQFLGVNFAGGNLTYATVVFNGTAGNAGLVLTGANTFANLTVTGGGRSITSDSNFTVTGTLTLTGSAQNSRLSLKTNTIGTVRTITAAAQSLTNVDFQYITAAGAIPWTGTSLGNSGNNTNITFTAAKNCYWNVPAGGNWNGTSWADTAGGTVANANYPLPQDTAFIVDTGLNAGATITLNNGETNGFMPSIDASGRTLAATINANIGNAIFSCTWRLVSVITLSGAATNIYGSSVINLGGATCTMTFTIQAGGTLTTQGAFASGNAISIISTGTFTCGVDSTVASITNTGTINLSTFTLTCTASCTLNAASTTNFGTGAITCSGSGTVFTGNATQVVTGTPVVNVTNPTDTATSVAPSVPTEANTISFVYSGGAYTLTQNTGAYRSLTFTDFVGTLANTGTINIYGNLTMPATGGAYNSGTFSWNFIGQLTTQIITTNGRILDWPFLQSTVSNTVQLATAFTLGITRTFTLTSGILNLNNFTLTCGLFSSTNINTRVIAFGSGAITVTGSGSAFAVTASGLTYTGTPTVNISNNSATALTLTAGLFTEATAFDYNITAGTYALTITNGSTIKSLNFTGYNGTWAPGTNTYTFYGSLTLVPYMTYTTGTEVFTFANTSGTAAITSAGKTMFSITQLGAGGTVQLADTMTLATTATYTYSAGTLNLNNLILTCGSFVSTSGTRAIAFGTGAITVIGSGTAFNVNGVSLTYTGTPTVNIDNNTATATTVTSSGFSSANALNFNYVSGTYALTDASAVYNNINWTGFLGTVPNTARTIYGNWTNPATGGTYTPGPNAQSFNAPTATGTQTITSNGRLLDFAITFGGFGANLQLIGSLTLGSTRLFTFNGATLNLNNNTLTCGTFSSTNPVARVIAFGNLGSSIVLTGSGTVWNTPILDSFSYTGISNITVNNNTATATTVITGAMTEAQALNFNYISGTYTLTDTTAVYKNVNWTGFAGTVPNSARTIYGNWTMPASGGTYTAGANAQTFAATTGTQLITSNDRSLDFPITVSGAGGTVGLGSNLTLGTGRTLTVTAGTFNASNANVTAGIFSLTGGTIAMGSGIWTATGSGAVWTATGVTVVPGTSTIKLTTVGTTQTFAGGGKTYNNLIFNPTSPGGVYIFTGNNTWNTISNDLPLDFTVTLPAGGTTTVNRWLATGSNDQMLGIKILTLNSSSAGVSSTLALTGPNPVAINYMSIRDSTVTPSTGTWYAGANSTSVSNNTGWIFAAFVPQAVINNFKLNGVTITT